MIIMTLNSISTCFFLDSGSSCSIIPLPVLIKKGLEYDIRPINIAVRGASGKKLNVTGCIRLYDQLLILTEDHTTPGDILIGYDFMKKRGMVIDLGNNMVILDGEVY